MTEQQARELAQARGIGAAAEADGQIVACAAIVDMQDGRGLAWAMLSEHALRHIKLIHRAIQGVLAKSPYRRIEMAVDAQHAAGCRWAERLGFEREGLMRAYTPDGRSCYLYARVQEN
jgi:RimJ/RimL family protein N-acetyltransferase